MSNAILWSTYKQNPTPELKKQIVLTYVNLVHYVIHKTNLNQAGVLDRRDYFQFGIEGLSEAIDRFDPDYGTKFETYAIQRIRGKIYDELRKYNTKYEISSDNDSSPTYTYTNLSLNHSVSEDEGMQLHEMIPSGSDKPDTVLEKKDMKNKLLDLIKGLAERERTILSLYYYEELNYKEIAQVLNITVSRVSQIHSRTLNSLKLRLADYNA
ncbi:MAG: sigma-70 family RNA polymerase sigma factor [Ignavibacteria bacterium]|jgi:RNA polymerase sigma factor for flagellar operon FliA|nr:sigma-70 family RNA polymerase sigma factor [Ignavibacteria bacterium]